MKTISKQGYSVMWIMTCFIFLSIVAGACKKTKPDEEHHTVVVNDSAKSILFVGNSLTYYNDLPGLVTRIGRDSGIAIKTEMVAYPNYALEDHWNDGQIQQLIVTKKYNFVVVQQGPSSQADGRSIIELVSKGERVFISMGSSHAPRIERTLKEMIQ